MRARRTPLTRLLLSCLCLAAAVSCSSGASGLPSTVTGSSTAAATADSQTVVNSSLIGDPATGPATPGADGAPSTLSAPSSSPAAGGSTDAAVSDSVATPTAVSPTAVRTPGVVPPNGTVLADLSVPGPEINLTGESGGDIHIFGSGGGFSVLSASTDGNNKDTSTFAAFDVSGTMLGMAPTGHYLGGCGGDDVHLPDGRRLLLTELVSSTAPQGIINAKYSLTLQAWDAGTGKAAWTVPLPVAADSTSVDCEANDDGTLPFVGVTSDNMWAFIADARDSHNGTAVNLATGAARPIKNVEGILGRYFVTGTSSDAQGNSTVSIVSPSGGAPLGSIQTGRDDGQASFYADNYVFAVTGVTAGSLSDSDPGTVLTSDGTGFIAQDDAVTRFDLPTGKVAWRYRSADGGNAIASGGGVVVVDVHTIDGVRYVLGLDEKTGRQLWKLPDIAGSSVCAVTNSQMAVVANSTLATIDIKTGKQLSYRADPYAGEATGSASCPTSLPGGLGYVQLQVAQIAQP